MGKNIKIYKKAFDRCRKTLQSIDQVDGTCTIWENTAWHKNVTLTLITQPGFLMTVPQMAEMSH